MESTAVLGISNIYVQLLILIGSILALALFNSAEAALLAANRLRIRHLAELGSGSAKAVERVVNKPEKFFAAISLTVNAFLIFTAAIGTVMAIGLVERADIRALPPELIATLVLTGIIVQFGEIAPKTLAARGATGWALVVARPIEFIIWAETIFIALFTIIPKLLYRLAGGDPKQMVGLSVTESELRTLIGVAGTEGAVHRTEAEMLEKVFHFGDRLVQEVVTPRTEIAWVEQGTTLQDFLALYAYHAHTRFPVFDGDHENVVGTLSVKDVLEEIAQGKLQPADSVTDRLRPAYFVPEAKPVAQLFDELQARGHQMAIAVDQHGGVSGLVTLKQLLEVIVGTFGEEGEPVEKGFVATGIEQFELSAGMAIEEANTKLALDLPEGDYQTLAGFMLKQMGRIPQVGDYFVYGNLRFEVKAMGQLRIEQVEVRRLPQPPQPPS